MSKEFVSFDLEFDAVYTFIGDPPGAQFQDVVELALARKFNEFLKVELGAVIKSGPALQTMLAWEWDFGGGQ